MKLKKLKVFIVGNQKPYWGGQYFIFVRLTSDNGIIGYGEVYAGSISPKAMKYVIEDIFDRHMKNEAPENIELMFRRVYSSGFSQRPDPTVIGAFSGLEMACLDILGKSIEKPIYSILGGCMQNKIRSYTYLYPLEHHNKEKFWSNPDMAVESAMRMLNLGFTALKFDPAGPYTIRGGHQPSMVDINLSIDFCNALRKAVGNKADLLFGTHGQFTTSGAIRLGKALEKYNLLWFEEPIPPDNIDEFKKVSEAVNIPIATGERHTTKSEFASLLKNGGVSILQPALGRSGGILETKKISAIAEVFNAQIAPHLYAGPVEWAANIQLATSIPNLLIAETILTGGEFHLKLIKNSIQWENGFILSPNAPGLGIEFDEQFANDNKYSGDKLHLEMQEAPCNYQREH
jgi:L-alanine-DL-glutamate epimerase-like enolase superfamily enzyme